MSWRLRTTRLLGLLRSVATNTRDPSSSAISTAIWKNGFPPSLPHCPRAKSPLTGQCRPRISRTDDDDDDADDEDDADDGDGDSSDDDGDDGDGNDCGNEDHAPKSAGKKCRRATAPL